MIPKPEPPSFRLIVRGIFQYPNGRRLTRTVTLRVTADPTDEERIAIAYHELLEELRSGYSFQEGPGVLIELLGATTLSRQPPSPRVMARNAILMGLD